LSNFTSQSSIPELTLSGTNGAKGSCSLEVWMPADGALAPVVDGHNLKRVQTTAVPGGWQIEACARDHYRLHASY
jgi:hypothetical protein